MDDVINLKRYGVAVIPVLNRERLEYYNRSFLHEIAHFPEYIDRQLLVKGGFGALGNPSSFHNLTIRELRMHMMRIATEFFTDFEEDKPQSRYLEQLFDRFSLRTEGSATTAESWHRDIAPLKEDYRDDDIFGGWVNLDLEKDQFFSCVMETHLDDTDTTGFSLGKDQKAIEREYRPRSTKVRVPPGHWIVFYQNILHEVLSIKQKTDFSMKQYFGWRLTRDPVSLFTNIDEIILNQGAPKIPSGQQPWMYMPNHLRFFQADLINWSNRTFHPVCLETKRNTRTREEYQVVKRYLPSLRDMRFPLYPVYTSDEIQIMKPTQL